MAFRRVHILLKNILRLLRRSLQSDAVSADSAERNIHVRADWPFSSHSPASSHPHSHSSATSASVKTPLELATFSVLSGIPEQGRAQVQLRGVDLEDPAHPGPAKEGRLLVPGAGSGVWTRLVRAVHEEGSDSPEFFPEDELLDSSRPGSVLPAYVWTFTRPYEGLDGVLFLAPADGNPEDHSILEELIQECISILEESLNLERELLQTTRNAEKDNLRFRMEQFRIRSLYEIASRPGLSPDARIREMLHLCAQVVDMETVSVLVPHPTSGFHTVYSTEMNRPSGPSLAESRRGFCEQILRTNSFQEHREPGVAYCIGLPLHAHGILYGTLFLSTVHSDHEIPSPEDRSFLELLARWVGSELESRKVAGLIDLFFDVSGDLLAILDSGGKALKVNGAWESNTGYTEQELLTRTMDEFLAQEERQSFLETLEEARSTGSVRGFRCRLRSRKGGQRWLSWSIRFESESGVFFASVRDITDSRQNEFRIMEYNERLNLVNRIARFIAEDKEVGETVDYTVDSVFELFPFFRVSYCVLDSEGTLHVRRCRTTDRMPDIEGLRADLTAASPYLGELQEGRTVRISDVRLDTRVSGILDALERGGTQAILDVPLMLGQDLKGILCLDSPTPHIWSTHETLTLEEASRALSAAMAAQNYREELLRAKDMAEGANRAKTEFLANMTHELRTPLHAVLGISDLLALEDLPPHVHDQLGIIRKSGNALLGIISSILDLTQIEADRLPLRLADFRTSTFFHDVLEAGTADRGKDVQLTVDISETVPEKVRADSSRFRQVLLNILGNAAKFTPAGSIKVRVDAEPMSGALEGRPNMQPELVGLQPSHELRFIVEDTGVGIDPEQIHTIFDTFHQADNSRTRHFGGTGLGLSLSRRLMEKMGGSIKVISEGSGKGSSFHLSLPVFPPSEPIPGHSIHP